MSKYTKEERIHVRKNVYAFKVSNDFEEWFVLYWNGDAPFCWKSGSCLGKLYDDIIESDFVVQYYICKQFAEENYLTFLEFGEKDWKNISKPLF